MLREILGRVGQVEKHFVVNRPEKYRAPLGRAQVLIRYGSVTVFFFLLIVPDGHTVGVYILGNLESLWIRTRGSCLYASWIHITSGPVILNY